MKVTILSCALGRVNREMGEALIVKETKTTITVKPLYGSYKESDTLTYMKTSKRRKGHANKSIYSAYKEKDQKFYIVEENDKLLMICNENNYETALSNLVDYGYDAFWTTNWSGTDKPVFDENGDMNEEETI